MRPYTLLDVPAIQAYGQAFEDAAVILKDTVVFHIDFRKILEQEEAYIKKIGDEIAAFTFYFVNYAHICANLL